MLQLPARLSGRGRNKWSVHLHVFQLVATPHFSLTTIFSLSRQMVLGSRSTSYSQSLADKLSNHGESGRGGVKIELQPRLLGIDSVTPSTLLF
ncbi:hypothetical protein IE53DRAFT_259409 [Violaceomyces palustris]|uniref:Uncharacterized protein n=1 Tax=Violaceomyces palustris TaxID=1673888 RepID=A0ACD0NN61_9BASI|nr:hypothetical protein IE53DRAFT_259409 [Violaceomyces palustris]